MSLELDHRQILSLVRDQHSMTVSFRPVPGGKRPKWRIELDVENLGSVRIRSFRGDERQWSTLDSAFQYAATTIPTATRFIVWQR